MFVVFSAASLYPSLSGSWSDDVAQANTNTEGNFTPVYPYYTRVLNNTVDNAVINVDGATVDATVVSTSLIPVKQGAFPQEDSTSSSSTTNCEILTTSEAEQTGLLTDTSQCVMDDNTGANNDTECGDMQVGDTVGCDDETGTLPPLPSPDSDIPSCTVMHPLVNSQLETPPISPAYAAALAQAAAQAQVQAVAVNIKE